MIWAGARGLRAALAVCALVGASALGVAAASAEDGPKPPPYDGAMGFGTIQGADGPEQFSWTVAVGPDQELVQIDERSAAVVDEGGHTAVRIEAPFAHDADGSSVPTTLAVSAGDVIALTVHHRAGNPAAGGAPFVYPIVAGVGWEGGFRTHPIEMPDLRESPPAPAAPTCVVPKLTGRTLAATRAKLAAVGCALGAVRGRRGKGVRVVKQFRVRGTVFAAGARVAVKLG